MKMHKTANEYEIYHPLAVFLFGNICECLKLLIFVICTHPFYGYHITVPVCRKILCSTWIVVLCVLEDTTFAAKCYGLSVACQQWSAPQMNTNYANGQGNPATTLQLCQAACINTTGCNGVDWVTTATAGQQCWLSGTKSHSANTVDLLWQ